MITMRRSCRCSRRGEAAESPQLPHMSARRVRRTRDEDEARTLKCITGDTLGDRVRNQDEFCEMQRVTRCARIRRRACKRDEPITGLQKSQTEWWKTKHVENVGARIGRHRRTGTLNKIHTTLVLKDEEEEEEAEMSEIRASIG